MKPREITGNIHISNKLDRSEIKKWRIDRRGSFFLNRKFWSFDGVIWNANQSFYFSQLFKSQLQPLKVKRNGN